MLDLITIGNIGADLYFSADDLTMKDKRLALAVGGKYRSNSFRMSVGGGGANVAIGARRYRLRTAVVGMVGNNIFRRAIMQRLTKAGVKTNLIQFNQRDSNVSVIFLFPDGERTIVTHQTSQKQVVDEQKEVRNLLRTRAVYFGNMPDVSAADRNRLMKLLKSKGILTIINMGKTLCAQPKAEINKHLEYADVLIVNTHEFAELVKKPLKSINFRKSILPFVPVMKDGLVIVTDGEKGSYGYRGNEVIHVPVVRTKVVDTTGVGDAYTSAFIAVFLRTDDVRTAMKGGARHASRILAKIGAN